MTKRDTHGCTFSKPRTRTSIVSSSGRHLLKNKANESWKHFGRTMMESTPQTSSKSIWQMREYDMRKFQEWCDWEAQSDSGRVRKIYSPGCKSLKVLLGWSSINRCIPEESLPYKSSTRKTPYGAWYGQKPSVDHLRVFECDAHAHVPKDEHGKFDTKARKCLLLG